MKIKFLTDQKYLIYLSVFILSHNLILASSVLATYQIEQRSDSFYSISNFEKLKDDGTEVLIESFGSITLPPEMEIQSGNYKNLNDKLKKIMGIESNSVVFQQNGLNEFNNDGFNTYARIMIKTDISPPETYPYINNLNISKKELKDIEKEIKQGIINSLSTMNMIITDWYPIQIGSIGNYAAIIIKYDRQLNNNPEVEVEQYMIFNNDRMHLLIFSNRIDDGYVWKPVFDKVKTSIDIIER